MLKQNLKGKNDKERKKYASLTGFSEKTIHQRLKIFRRLNILEIGEDLKELECLFKYAKLFGK